MMRCNKCRSENVLNEKLYEPFGACYNCGHIFTMGDMPECKRDIELNRIEEEKQKATSYQQRLDKILSKMNKVNDWYELKITIIDGLYLYYDSDVGFCLSWNDDGVWTYDDLPSLDTVESLLKDLEAQDE